MPIAFVLCFCCEERVWWTLLEKTTLIRWFLEKRILCATKPSLGELDVVLFFLQSNDSYPDEPALKMRRFKRNRKEQHVRRGGKKEDKNKNKNKNKEKEKEKKREYIICVEEGFTRFFVYLFLDTTVVPRGIVACGVGGEERERE